ncbi:DUF1156 domain-containing protein [uncultured Psychrobacter sp.]|uniref:DUF1156 domain-containing protein n=1 Tax=uncultured Psychrobacter sp. TaxID=259303 RepID=UPI002608E82E|nr:DUF1156 domain-containing protein [uncultured Psychrobacter sp.]
MQNSKEAKVYSPKKLIEVALPLDDINTAAAREKSIRHGHPSTLHLWWARRPLAAARAVIFAQMVNDPGYQQGGGFKFGVNKKEAEIKREKLFEIIRDLVKWENTKNEEVLARAREAIKESWRETCELNKKHPQAAELFNPEKLPAFHDPFAGGGAIPLEAQRLGLESYASDLNPVAVMINKAMIEIPPKFVNQSPVGPIPEGEHQQEQLEGWAGASGLAEDVRRYGLWMKEEAEKRIGHLYPKVLITDEMINERPDLEQYRGQELTVIAWLWARTVKSPNPAFTDCDTPLVSSLVVSDKKDKEAYVDIVVNSNSFEFKVVKGKTKSWTEKKKGTKSSRNSFNCIYSSTAITLDYVKQQAKAGKMSQKLMCIVAEGKKERLFLSPSSNHEKVALGIERTWESPLQLPPKLTGGTCYSYGLETWGSIFTNRQLLSLNTFTEVVSTLEVKSQPTDYQIAIKTYLSFLLSQIANHGASICGWNAPNNQMRSIFARQAIPMTWDFAESNPFSNSTGSFNNLFDRLIKAFTSLGSIIKGNAYQSDAISQEISKNKVVSTDPPYYDNIAYADLSDLFYSIQRKALKNDYPDLFSTLAAPKDNEITALKFRHKSIKDANTFFETNMLRAIQNLYVKTHPAFPVTIYYAFKQSDTKEGSTASTGWETFLEAVIGAGFSIDGTWPIRTEKVGRVIGNGTNALASSVVLVCKKREDKESVISRREFQRELRMQMPEALDAMVGGETGTTPIEPVDLAQSAIGPGMAIYSKYSSVLNQDGSKMSVHDALIMINKSISDYLNPEGADFDNDTLFCDSWFSQYGFGEGKFGEADTLARAKGTSVEGLVNAGVVESSAGKVRLLKWAEYPTDWNPQKDTNTPIWEACHQLIRTLNQEGESAAGQLLALMPERGEAIRRLAYHLYTLCERKKWADEARAYNELMGSWSSIVSESHAVGQVHYGENMDFEF